MIPQWVMDQDGIKDDWDKFKELFLTGFTEGEEYHVITSGDYAGIIAGTAENPHHRRPGRRNKDTIKAHLHQLPGTKSVATNVSKHVRLLIAPEEKDAEQRVVVTGAAVLVFRTKVTDIVGEEEISRPATEAIRAVKRAQLEAMVSEYREDHAAAAGDTERPALKDMVIDTRHGEALSLRCELWGWVRGKGLLEDDVLREIFAAEMSEYTWVSVESANPNGAHSGPRPQALRAAGLQPG